MECDHREKGGGGGGKDNFEVIHISGQKSFLGTDSQKNYGGGGRSRKKYLRKGKLNEKNSGAPINTKKIFIQGI